MEKKKNTGVGCPVLFEGIFWTQASNQHLLCLLHWQGGTLSLVPPGKPLSSSLPVGFPLWLLTLRSLSRAAHYMDPASPRVRDSRTERMCMCEKVPKIDSIVFYNRHDWATSLSLFTFMHWRRKWQPTPVFLPGESQGWGRTGSDTTKVT